MMIIMEKQQLLGGLGHPLQEEGETLGYIKMIKFIINIQEP